MSYKILTDAKYHGPRGGAYLIEVRYGTDGAERCKLCFPKSAVLFDADGVVKVKSSWVDRKQKEDLKGKKILTEDYVDQNKWAHWRP